MKRFIEITIAGFIFLFIVSSILAQPISFLSDDTVVNEILKKRGDKGKVLFHKATECYQNRDYGKAIKYFMEVIAINPDDCEAYSMLGIIYSEKGDFKKAVEYYQKATNIYPGQMALIATTAIFSPLNPDYRTNFYKALENYKSEIANSPNDYQSYNNIGYLSFILGDGSKFKEYYKKSIEIKPDYAQAHYNLATYYLYNEDMELALEEYKILERLNKDLAKVILRVINLAEKTKKKNNEITIR